jgi:hypothetical protein
VSTFPVRVSVAIFLGSGVMKGKEHDVNMQRKSRCSETIKVFFRVRPLNAREKQDGRNM